LADRLDDATLRAQWLGFSGFSAYYAGRWRKAYEQLSEGAAMMRDHSSGLSWEADTSQAYALFALYQLGELGELSKQLPKWMRVAEDRGDLYFAANLSAGYSNAHWLAQDAADEGRARVEELISSWSRRSFHVQHWFAMRALCMADLYRGDFASAMKRLDEGMDPLRRSMLLRLQTTRAFASHLLAGCALAHLRDGGASSLRAVVRREIRRLRREALPWVDGLADTLEAGLALHEGAAAAAAALSSAAIAKFEACEMAGLAQATRLQGAIVGGDVAVQERTTAWFVAHGVKAPERFARAVIPGFRR
jgi:hypothetical protein